MRKSAGFTEQRESIRLPGIEVPVSRVGLGGCPLGGHGWGAFDEAEAVAAVRRAAEMGVTLFDTADVYGLGHSERLLAEALGADRHRLCISSKGGVRRTASGTTYHDTSPRWMRQAVEDSLRRLRLDHVPLYYIHWPDGTTPLEETVTELDRCRAEGKIGAIGVCNVDGTQLAAACEVAAIAAVQVNYSLLDREAAESLLPTARRLGVPLVTWGSLAQGLLAGRMTAETRFGADDRRSRYRHFTDDRFPSNVAFASLVREQAEGLGRTAAQVAVRWLLDEPGVGAVLFGAKRPQQVEENVGALGWRLDPSVRDSLDRASVASPAIHSCSAIERDAFWSKSL
jgi:aryl-alcohol dehydrogenase-like predicted oxidoreductase